ncbi:two-component system regulatory protein YycI [Enterococcus hirae]|uniref:two-component system regulatory protein YycI n=1 Tax=Enterococcus hirae TaxID=1354 RepID=UPI001094E911|nr:two-component system regulatory protein YycI [Enterococcus hirae]EMF0040595.1 two-component system regulatory protein YycI [Enterococcus hirae]EMF0113759.1 two-component system regulatory protein YycI [Enterococcus hirae]MCR1911429.1 two-component system regulatory protein YycI [Enterococcus hirae]MDL4887042.1 two-component system regulatory protein YycI [Enterococcus hirae]MDL4890082.1 two-component system regulatory protein YycI [Enterococcus hirae]
MDFKKIEWIFFVAFLGLNVFLFRSYQETISQENNVIRSGQTESIQQRLSSDDISYTGKISSESRQGYYLSAEETDLSKELDSQRHGTSKKGLLSSGIVFNDNVLTKTLSETESENSIFDPDKMGSSVNSFLNKKNNVLFGSDYVYMKNFSDLDSATPEVQASQKYDGLPFYDDTAKIVFSLNKQDKSYAVTKYRQTHLSDIEQLREKTELHTEEDAIKTLYVNNKISRGSKILWRQLAYSCILKVREKNVYVPVWYVAIETPDKSIQVESVNAFSNTIVTNNTIPKVEDH